MTIIMTMSTRLLVMRRSMLLKLCMIFCACLVFLPAAVIRTPNYSTNVRHVNVPYSLKLARRDALINKERNAHTQISTDWSQILVNESDVHDARNKVIKKTNGLTPQEDESGWGNQDNGENQEEASQMRKQALAAEHSKTTNKTTSTLAKGKMEEDVGTVLKPHYREQDDQEHQKETNYTAQKLSTKSDPKPQKNAHYLLKGSVEKAFQHLARPVPRHRIRYIRRRKKDYRREVFVVKDKKKGSHSEWYGDILNGNFAAELVRVQNKTEDSPYLTEKLWSFNEKTERLFLYNRLLSREWSSNTSNLQQLRHELEVMGITAAENLALTRKNAPLHSPLPLYFSRADDHYTVSDTVWKTLPEISPFRGQTYKRCAVVGNSGGLLHSSCGKQIDSFDMVFRCNAAPIAKYGKDAGWKSNITTLNPSILLNRFNALSREKDVRQFRANITQYNGFMWLPCFGSAKLHEVCLNQALTNMSRLPDEPTVLVAHPIQYIRFWDFWRARNVTKAPSTGFFMTHAALQLCDETHLYGFWPFPLRLDSQFERVPYHYFDDIVVSKYHGMSDEFSVLVQYHEFGILRLHMNKCHGEA